MEFKKREPKFLTDDPHEGRKKNFTRHEKATAKLLGGVGTVGSGNKGMKGDVHGGARDVGQRVMAEAKTTDKRQLTLKQDWLEKLVKESFEARMDPVLMIRFSGLSTNFQDWAVLPAHRYQELLDLEARVKREEAA